MRNNRRQIGYKTKSKIGFKNSKKDSNLVDLNKTAKIEYSAYDQHNDYDFFERRKNNNK